MTTETGENVANSSSFDWAGEVDRLYNVLKGMGVVDVKFAFGTIRGKTPDEIYKAVAVALQAIIDKKCKPFRGLNDSYGLKSL